MKSASFAALGCINAVAVLDPRVLPEALAVVRAVIRDVDRTCSRFRADSELVRVNRSGGEAVPLTALFEEALQAALRTAEMTGGLVDPTIGTRLQEIGYTVTFRDLPADGPPIRLRAQALPDWTALEYSPDAHTLRLPPGVALDFGASGKAWAADRAAQAAAERVGTPVLVSCGGDLAVAGPPPEGGWPVRVELEPGADGQAITVYDGGLATSGTGARRWRRGGRELHHIIDPATGLPAETPWAMVTVAGATCVDANAAATAAIILGEAAPAWLDGRGLPARLQGHDGAVVTAGGWAA